MTILCYNYSKELEEAHIDLLFNFALEDINENMFTWDTFFKCLKLAAKKSSFFPTYDKITKEIRLYLENHKYDGVSENTMQIEGVEDMPDNEFVEFCKSLTRKMSRN